MLKLCLPNVLLPFIFSLLSLMLDAQDFKENRDTSFLPGSNEHAVLKVNPIDSLDRNPVKIANPFLAYSGKTIRNIRFVQLGFERNIRDTTVIKNDFGVIMANGLHTKTKTRVIRNNLFFTEGDILRPYLLADNERQLRDQIYIQDARILIDSIAGCSDSVDVVVITKDIFPLTAALIISNPTKMRLSIRNESVAGSGSRLFLGLMYDQDRSPKIGYGAAFVKRNILGSFIDWGAGFQTYNNAFNSGRREETFLYTIIERPFVTPYIPWIGALSLTSNKTNNYYLKDSLYNSDYKYSYRSADLWVGYNFSSKLLLSPNKVSRVNKLVALRTFYQKFADLPDKNRTLYDYRYANITGVLGSFNIFKQDVYRTKLLYGFGKNEDLIQGFSASIITGWSVKENRGRPYLGTQLIRSHFSHSGFYTTYVFRMGGNLYNTKLEDANILINVDHFTRLKKINEEWFNRSFFSAGFSHQINPVLDQPLQISSAFGLPYFRSILAYSASRTTVKAESVFYNMRSFLGFKLAPFIFADMSMLTPLKEPDSKSQVYSAIGGGIRTGNDNLSIGTFELRAFYFPRTLPGMKNFRAEIGANIRFKYNGIFVLRPDFVIPN
jgi:hypothetical protein